MRMNVGKIDRVSRTLVGVALLSLWFFDPSNMIWLIGFVPLLTGVAGFCPLYSGLRISTVPKKTEKRDRSA